MKSVEEIMNMLEAFDLTGSCRDAGELAGVSHHTVARYVQARNAGDLSGSSGRRAPCRTSVVCSSTSDELKILDSSSGPNVNHRSEDRRSGLLVSGCKRSRLTH